MKDISKIMNSGHTYEIENMNGTTTQTIQFIEKEKNLAGEFVTVTEGTTNEEVIDVLIDRLNKLNAKFPCRENAIAITKLEEARLWLGKRTADRIKRGVEGTPNK